MTEQRIMGPVRGAGTQVNETVGRESIDKGKLGSTVIVGVFERGLEGDITQVPSKRSFDRKMGGLLDPSDFDVPGFASLHAPLCSKHFWERSGGKGNLTCLRVVPRTNTGSQDDRPTKSTMLVFNRESEPILIGSITAHNGGAWAGKDKTYLGRISGVPATDFPASNQVQFQGLAAKTLQMDEFRNGELTLDGLPAKSYRVVNNTPLGLFTLEADEDVEGDWGDGETAGSVVGTVSGSSGFNLDPGDTLIIHCDENVGGPDTATFNATRAVAAGAGLAIVDINTETVLITIDNGEPQTITFTAAHTGDPDGAAAEINAQLIGGSAVVNAGQIDIYSDTYGTGSEVDITGGTALTELGHSVGVDTGTGNVANINAVTFSEAKTIIEAAVTHPVTGVTVTQIAGGYLVITSDTTGATSSVQVEVASTADDEFGLDNVLHSGTDGPSDFDAQVTRGNMNERDLTKAVDVEFRNGTLRSGSEFGMLVRIDGKVVLNYDNLSMDTSSTRYWADVINEDPNNDVITITDTFSGNRLAASARPANHCGLSDALTFTRLTIADPNYVGLTVGGTWVPTFTMGSWGDYAKPQRIRVTMTNATDFTVTTDIGNRTWAGVIGVAVDMGEYGCTFTVTTLSGTPQAADRFDVYLKPLRENECVGGRVYPNTSKAQAFKIIANGVNYVDVSELNDLTDDGDNTAGDEYRIEYPQQMAGGYDGYIAGMTTADYEALLDVSTTPLAKLKIMGLGQVKVAVPGVSYYDQAVSLQQKVHTLCKLPGGLNWMAKSEIPWEFHDWDVYYEENLIDWVDNTLGRTEYASIHFPSYGYIRDPLAEDVSEARIIVVPLIGMILGEEARIANEYGNHHKAPAGVNTMLPDIIKLPAVGKLDNPKPLDEEVLNPSGINIIKWHSKTKRCILWGDRTLSDSSVFKFMHKRNLMCQFENDLLEGFDFTIFEINDPIEDANVLLAFHDYFLPEWRRRAIRGKSFVGGTNPAAIFKMDEENNTDATRAQGDQIIEASLRLADTIERLRIFIGPMGVVEGSL